MWNLTFLTNLSFFKLDKVSNFRIITDGCFRTDMGIRTNSHTITNFAVSSDTLFNHCFFTYIAILDFTMWSNLRIFFNNGLTRDDCSRIYNHVLLNNNISLDICVIWLNYTYSISHITFIY